MRILFVTNNYTPYSGGVVSSINATIKGLRAQGHELLLVAPDFIGAKHNDPQWVRRVPSFFRFMYKKNHMAIMWRPKRFIKKIIESLKPDVVHVHHPFLLGPIAAAIAKERGIKTIFTYHTMYESYAHYVPLPAWVVKPIVRRRVLSFCTKIDQIVVPSATIANYLREHAITNARIIPSGLMQQYTRLPFIQKTVAMPYQLLYVGRFAQEKNVAVLFDVIKQLPKEYTLCLVGYGADLGSLKEYAYEQLKLETDRVRFIVKPDQKTLIELYRSAHLFLFPSHTDTQGLVLAEAMACSTPVVALDGPGQRDIVQHGKNGVIVSHQNNMAQMIQKIFSNQSTYEQLQKNAWYTAQKYKTTRLIGRLCQVYEQ